MPDLDRFLTTELDYLRQRVGRRQTCFGHLINSAASPIRYAAFLKACAIRLRRRAQSVYEPGSEPVFSI